MPEAYDTITPFAYRSDNCLGVVVDRAAADEDDSMGSGVVNARLSSSPVIEMTARRAAASEAVRPVVIRRREVLDGAK
jgi:hypothetical protein